MSTYATTKELIDKYNVEIVDHWDAPETNDARIIGMPNIPKPVQGKGCQPRTILGPTTWNHMRRRCYAIAEDTCEICGAKPENKSLRHSHEVFSIDYKNGVSKFERCICLCYTCHILSIHNGRALTLYKNHSPIMSKESILLGAENAFKIAREWNDTHDEKFKLYGNFLNYLKVPTLEKEMLELIEKYKPEFYISTEGSKKSAGWGEWKVIVGNNEYPSPYQSEKDWEDAMEDASKNDTDRNAKTPLKGGVFDKLDELLQKPVENF